MLVKGGQIWDLGSFVSICLLFLIILAHIDKLKLGQLGSGILIMPIIQTHIVCDVCQTPCLFTWIDYLSSPCLSPLVICWRSGDRHLIKAGSITVFLAVAKWIERWVLNSSPGQSHSFSELGSTGMRRGWNQFLSNGKAKQKQKKPPHNSATVWSYVEAATYREREW